METMQVWVLSTAHISPQDRETLLRLACDDYPWMSWRHGWLFLVPEDMSAPEYYPPTVLPVIAKARRLGFGWVRLDSDGPLDDDTDAPLQTFLA